jgi:hypothetical protein
MGHKPHEQQQEPSSDQPLAAASARSVKIGRPTKCTPETTAKICAEVAKGMPKKFACARAGVDYANMLDWEKRGVDGEEPFASFARALADARAAHVAMRLEAIEAGEGDWKRQAWLLERLEPTLFGPTSRTQVTGADGGPVQMAAQVVVVPALAASSADWASGINGELSVDGEEA